MIPIQVPNMLGMLLKYNIFKITLNILSPKIYIKDI